MIIIADSSPLIVIVKISQLHLLRELYTRVLIPGAVLHEVVIEGKRLHKSGANEIENAVQAGWIKTIYLTETQLSQAEKYRLAGHMGKGEAEVISLAVSRKLPIIIDDRNARRLASTLGVKFQGIASMLLEAYISKLLDKKEYIESLGELGKVMWLAPEVMVELIRLSEAVNSDDKERSDGRNQTT